MGARAGTDDPHRPVVMLGDDDRLAASERQAACAVARLAQMQRIAAALSGRLEPDEVAEVIIRDTAPELGGVSRALWLLDESGSRLRLVRSEQHPRAAPFADLAVDGDLPGSEVARWRRRYPGWPGFSKGVCLLDSDGFIKF